MKTIEFYFANLNADLFYLSFIRVHSRDSRAKIIDPRGIRFVVLGNAKNKTRSLEVVCRFLPTGLLRIITVYQIEE